MGIETSVTISGLNEAWPLGTDPRAEGDNHLRLVKSVLKLRFDDSQGGTLKLKDVSNLEEYVAGKLRLQLTSSTAATAGATITAYDNTATKKAAWGFDAGGMNHYGDGGAGDIWWQSVSLTGIVKFRIAYVLASAYTELVSFDGSGVRVGNIGLDANSFYSSSRIIQWNPSKLASEISHYDWYGPDAGLRRVVDPNGNVFTQKVNAAINTFVNYHIINATSRSNTFLADVVSDTGGFVTSTFGKGLHMASAGAMATVTGFNFDAWGTGPSPRNNVELSSWWGFGFRCLTDNYVRWSVDTRTGNTLQGGTLTVGGAVLFQDGNLMFGGSMAAGYGTYLSDALYNGSRWNNQSALGALGYPIGTTLMMYTNGVQVQRNTLTNPCVSATDNIYYRLQGQPNAGARLDGNWRACGHVDSNWVQVQRIP